MSDTEHDTTDAAGDMDAVARYYLANSAAYRLYAADSPQNRERLHAMIAAMDPTGFAHTLRAMLSVDGTTADLIFNVRKAIEKVQRDQDQAQKNLLRELSQGLSSQDLAANGGALLDKLLNQAATIQTGAEGLRIDAILQANADIASAVELSLDAQQALIEASEETANSLTELLAEEKAALGEIKSILERQSSELNAAKAERKELRRALSLLS